MTDSPLESEQHVSTIAQVLTGEPVMIVEHWENEGWVFRPRGSYYFADIVDVPFVELLRVDVTLAELADLPADWVASRRALGQPWRRRWIYEDTRYIWDTKSAELGAAADGGRLPEE
jgi:hypothetical protein